MKGRVHKFLSAIVGPTIIRGEQIVIGVTGIFVSIAIFVQVVLRYVFYAPLFGIEEFLRMVIIWFYFIGAAYAVYKESFIKADIMPMLIKKQLHLKRLKVASLLLSAVAATLLFYYALQYSLFLAAAHQVTPIHLVSLNYGAVAVVLGAGLMSFQFIIHLRRELGKP